MADEFFGRGGEPLSIVCLVQQSNPVIVDGRPRFHVSVAFVGETYPDSYNADPSQSYAVCGSHENGFFRITESEKPFKTRRHPRFRFELELTLVHIKKTDKSVVRAAGFTKNVSVSGLSIVSSLEAQIGDKIKVGSPDLDFYGLAVVRNRKSLIGVENLLHLEFLDFDFPTSRVSSVLAKQQAVA
ncbi:MAG: PilZ domain-containing protein [Pyrinomonadaceae bacterium]